MIFKVIPHLILNKNHLIAGSSNIISSENYSAEEIRFRQKKTDFLEFPLIQLNLTSLKHYPILASLSSCKYFLKG